MSRTLATRVARVLWLVFVLASVLALATAAWAWLLQSPATGPLPLKLAGQDFELQAPRWLALAALVPLLWLAPLFSLSDLPWPQRALSLLLRSAWVLALVVALARPAQPELRHDVATVFVVDVSASVPDAALEQARAFIDEALAAAPRAPAQLITFAAEPREQALAPPGEPGAPRRCPPLERQGDGLASDPEAALKMAYGLFPGDHLRRVVLLSDGYETEGDLLSEALQARRFGVRLHTRSFDPPRPPEALVADLELPETIEVGSPIRVKARISSTAQAAATLTLWLDDFKEGSPVELTLEPGLTEVELPATVREPGFKRFRVDLRLAPEADHFRDNNSFARVAVVRGKPRVLLLEGDPRQARYLERALRGQGLEVDLRGSQGMPSRLEDLEGFDLVLISDVPASALSQGQMGLLGSYLRELGGGLVMTGGEDSLSLGGYFRSPLEALLPVSLDVEKRRETPSLALALLIDKSGSMADDKIELAKEAAKAVVEVLDPRDRVAIIAFDSSPEVLVRLQPARNRLRIETSIARLRGGGGTSILPALQSAFDQLVASGSAIRHVILLTDGQTPREGIMELAEEMAAERISISTVAVGQEADRSLLAALAEQGGGRSYFTSSMRAVPRLFVKETQTVSRNALIEEPFRPVQRRAAQMLRGIPLAQAPYLLGYVATRAKPGAEVLLTTERGDPLLARWNVGLGTALVWTSDIKNRWSLEWLRWRSFAPFWAQLVRATMRQRDDLGYSLWAELDERGGRIVLDAVGKDDRFVNGMATVVEVNGPKGLRRKVTLEQVAAGRYEGTVDLPHYGSYLLKAQHAAGGRALGTTLGGIARPYPPELLVSGVDAPLLARAARLGGGAAQVAPQQVWDPGDESLRSATPRRRDLLLLALGLWLVDLALRRLRLWGARELRFPN